MSPFLRPSFPFSARTFAALLVLVPFLNASTITVDTLVAEALRQNPEIAFYEAEISLIRAEGRLATTAASPELAVSIGQKRVRDALGAPAGEGLAWSVSVSQTLAWPGRQALRKAIADQNIALAELGLEQFRNALAERVRFLAQGWEAARVRAEATKAVATRLRALREVFVARDPAGVAPLLELRVLEAQELMVAQRATQAQVDLSEAQLELNQLRSVALDTEIVLEVPELRPLRPAEHTLLIERARSHHFEYRAALLELERQGLQVTLTRHERRPSLTVSPYFSEERADGRERTYGLGLSVPLPLTRAGQTSAAAERARLRQAEAALQVADLRLQRAVVQAAQEVNARLADYERWSPAAAAQLEEAAALADRHFRLGAVTLATYVELQTTYLDAVEAYAEAQQALLEANHTLRLLTGDAGFTSSSHP